MWWGAHIPAPSPELRAQGVRGSQQGLRDPTPMEKSWCRTRSGNSTSSILPSETGRSLTWLERGCARCCGASLVAQLVKNPPAMQETLVRFLGQEDSLEKGQSTHSSILGHPWWLRRQRIRLQCGRPGFDPWVGKIPWRRERLPTPVLWPGEFHGERSLGGYSPWDCKESDTTERLPHTEVLWVLIAWHFMGLGSSGEKFWRRNPIPSRWESVQGVGREGEVAYGWGEGILDELP